MESLTQEIDLLAVKYTVDENWQFSTDLSNPNLTKHRTLKYSKGYPAAFANIINTKKPLKRTKRPSDRVALPKIPAVPATPKKKSLTRHKKRNSTKGDLHGARNLNKILKILQVYSQIKTLTNYPVQSKIIVKYQCKFCDM